MPAPPADARASGTSRERLRFASRHALQDAAARLLEDPRVESCSIDVPNLVVEIARAGRGVARPQAVADGRRRRHGALRPRRP